MNFGEKLRRLRTENNLTQPELAEATSIEQSYLSKLENGKSLPSNDVLNKVLDVFDLEVGDLVDDLDQGSRNQLRHVPDVAAYINQEKQRLIGNRQRWLLISALLLSSGAALIYGGTVNLFFSNFVYEYTSYGVINPGESKEVFVDFSLSVQHSGGPGENRAAAIDAINARRDEEYLQAREFRGNTFNVPVAGGSRTYHLEREVEIDPWQNKAIAFVGMFLMMLGLVGIVLERKLSRPG